MMRSEKSDVERVSEALAMLGSVSVESPDLSKAINDAKLQLVNCLALAAGATQGTTGPSSEQHPSQELHEETSLNEDDPHFGASMAESAVLIIKELDRPCGPAELVKEFETRKLKHVESGSKTAMAALIKALSRRAKHAGDVFKNPKEEGKWDLTERYDSSELAILLSEVLITQDFEKQRQRQRTRAGMERAQKRGTKIGAKRKFDKDKALAFHRLRNKGLPTRAICEQLEISAQTFYKNRSNYEKWTAELNSDDADKIVQMPQRAAQ